MKNVKVVPFEGLLIEFAKQMDAKVIIRGLRAVTDFEYELQMSQTNHKLNPNIETLFMTTSLEYSFLSSSTVRELASFGGDISQFVPKYVEEQVIEKMKEKRRV
jgi:pantetheine-phosphate adenylyltransferase